MADHLTDEEQLQALKNWWKDNGKSLVSAILLALIAYFGFQWWQNYQQQQGEKASALYSELLETIEVQGQATLSDEKKATAKFLITQLKDEFADTQYAINASLFAAKLFVNDKNLDEAEKSLLWVVNHSDKNIKHLAQLRLARIYISQEKTDEALALLNTDSVENVESFTSLYAELRGDILLAKNDTAGARKAYEQALATIGESAGFRRNLLPIKLSNVPVGDQ